MKTNALFELVIFVRFMYHNKINLALFDQNKKYTKNLFLKHIKYTLCDGCRHHFFYFEYQQKKNVLCMYEKPEFHIFPFRGDYEILK